MTIEEWAQPLRHALHAALLTHVQDARPPRLAEALAHPIRAGGKRIRPLLTIAAFEAVGGKDLPDALLRAGCAIELVHTYSLVHDDLPCMDDDDERRGQPTVHVAFDEATAVLVGDGLLTLAFSVLAGIEEHALAARLVGELAHDAGVHGMIGGQADDVGLAGPIDALDALTQLHQKKTGALIRWATRAGGWVAGAPDAHLRALTTYGDAVGLAFQLADDVLDAEEDQGESGPPSFVKLLGVDETQRRAQAQLEIALQAAHTLPNPQALDLLARFAVERTH